MESKINQTKLNATSAKILHTKAKKRYDRLNNLILGFTLIVPLFFIIALYITKEGNLESVMNTISFSLSLILIALSILSLILKITDKITIHKIGIRNNISIVNECDNIAKLSGPELEWFYKYVAEIDSLDSTTFAGISDVKKMDTYRNALKEVDPGNHKITCPICQSSPWKYVKGDCQLCGNTKTKL